jgi:hypothetical protein
MGIACENPPCIIGPNGPWILPPENHAGIIKRIKIFPKTRTIALTHQGASIRLSIKLSFLAIGDPVFENSFY